MHIERIGFTPIKGGRHLAHDHVDLTIDGPAGDRMFSLVDLESQRILRTVANSALLTTSSRLAEDRLTVEIDNRIVSGIVRTTGQTLPLEYWGRTATVQVVEGPWASAFSALLGRTVALTRSTAPGEVVYGASVTLVTTSALRLLEEKLGHAVDARRFRSTFVVDTAGESAAVEDSWQGRQLDVGAARISVSGAVDRCAVIDFDPSSGDSGTQLLKTLAGYRILHKLIDFGVFATVVRPGRVHSGDPVSLVPR